MSVRIAIVADDLTGALDTSAPFVRHGLSVVVAVSVAALDQVVRADAEVVVVNTGSRELSAPEAVERVDAAAFALQALAPDIVFKKIDSRLKGHVRAETAAMLQRTASRTLVVAPAVPDQGRPTRNGMVTGTGVPAPIPIEPTFAGLPVGARIADAETDADLDAIAAGIASGTLTVGARGLGAALARRFRRTDLQPLLNVASPHLLMAIGSRDPITSGQIDSLHQRYPEIAIVEAPDGLVPAVLPGLPLLLRCSGAFVPERSAAVAGHFADGVAGLVRRFGPECLWITGGETGLAVLDALDMSLVKPLGEVAPGVPLITGTMGDGSEVRCVLKSGGFGAVDVFEAAFESAPRAHMKLAGG